MITQEQLKLKYEAIREHFTFKDFLGLSALIFGLLLSNSSSTSAKQAHLPKPEAIKQEDVQKSGQHKDSLKKKKISKKKVAVPKKKQQQISAAIKPN